MTSPLHTRRHVTLIGNTNAGKSSVMNALLGQNAAIVSPQPGTTTDPVLRAMELIPYGPVALADTAGLDDRTPLGEQRRQKTRAMLLRTDLAVYVADASDFRADDYDEARALLAARELPHALAFNKCDVAPEELLERYRRDYPDAVFIHRGDVAGLAARLSDMLSALGEDAGAIVGDLLPAGSTVVMVAPIDGEAPAGRLILPQVQLLRDCLDHHLRCTLVQPEELPGALEAPARVDLVVTDSQAFAQVNAIVPPDIALTSFSMLLARRNGDLAELLRGVRAVDSLREGATVLIAEACTHTTNHEDIGQVKIPALLRKKTGKRLNIRFVSGHDFPEPLTGVDLVVHCGGCMINRRAMLSRIALCRRYGVPVTNYGILLAALQGILPRCSAIFERDAARG